MMVAVPKQLPQWLADSAGMFASIACAIHCAAMPLVIGYLPMLGLSWLADESFHQVMAAVCFVLAVAAFVPGWRKHGSLLPATIGLAGITVITTAAFTLEGECCPTCVAASEASAPGPTSKASAISQLVGAKLVALPQADSELACDDEHCPHCVAAKAESQASVSASAVTEEMSNQAATAWFLPFITPIGGVLLIAGHLVNHQKSCRCNGQSCCLPPTSGEDD